MIKKLIGISLIALIGLSLLTKEVRADYMYGETEISRKILVDKKVKPISWDTWYDNLSLNDYAFSAQDLVEFKVIIKNTGSNDLEEIKVADTLPGSVNFVLGDGNYQKDNHQVTWEIDHLSPNEQKEFKIRAQVTKIDELPTEGTFPIVNRVRAESKTGEADEDTAQFYLKGQAQQLPEAGINLVLGTVLALGATATGLLGRKFGRGEILG